MSDLRSVGFIPEENKKRGHRIINVGRQAVVVMPRKKVPGEVVPWQIQHVVSDKDTLNAEKNRIGEDDDEDFRDELERQYDDTRANAADDFDTATDGMPFEDLEALRKAGKLVVRCDETAGTGTSPLKFGAGRIGFVSETGRPLAETFGSRRLSRRRVAVETCISLAICPTLARPVRVLRESRIGWCRRACRRSGGSFTALARRV